MDDERSLEDPGDSSGDWRPLATAVVVPYDSQWPQQFESLRALVDAALAAIPHHTEHVGNTAVIGLDAKPIIDIDVLMAREASGALDT